MADNKQDKPTKKPLGPALTAAHAAITARQKAREGLTEAQIGTERVQARVAKAAKALAIGRASVAATARSNRQHLTDAQKEKVVTYLHQMVSRVETELYSRSLETPDFLL